MKILSIETSCDETSIAVIEAGGDISAPKINVLGHALFSQIETHRKFGGVYPNLAKREHAQNFTPLLVSALSEANLINSKTESVKMNAIASILTQEKFIKEEQVNEIRKLLEREPETTEALIDFLSTHEKPEIDAIAVTVGPGLEPTLWVGIQCAEALACTWNLPLFGINHMEGHIFSVLSDSSQPTTLKFPLIALLVSGGHTQLIKSDSAGKYTLLGETRDDASGEAFDKIARILGLPYPGGPEISRLATMAREKNVPKIFSFPRPMINTPDFDFSFSGLKTSVLYTIQKHGTLSENEKLDAAREAEDAIIDVLIAKTKRAIEAFPETQNIVVAGGVASNTELRERMKKLEEELNIPVLFPSKELSTDNAIMIGVVCYIRSLLGDVGRDVATNLKASGRLSL
ncbi:MAG: O-sialoglycoprotein endopeptidase [Candidatus Doudnabacteria bacterium Gr01-1014_77]|uniref:tRNA N6-adenosine threonylcarbamoyltransferase n=1 Tax=Candidatus Doudnabacteria bacterium Gr01-1014_77 TaxID=2017133 RepID=A0A554JAG0_9BACT|nr:MAG: O-sialoglycoprotein endopeptidase [Candidatus Doudnabacteria bacterium Gr01-1014_77]